MLDMGKQNNDVNQGSNFESNLEDFYATLDQVEVALRCAIDCHQQAQSSNRYMQIPPNPSRLENVFLFNVFFKQKSFHCQIDWFFFQVRKYLYQSR